MRSLVVLPALLCLASTGCEEPSSRPDPTPGPAGDVEPGIQEIVAGQVGGLQQSVHIETSAGRCTGILLNPVAVLTSAHCLHPVAELQWASVNTRVGVSQTRNVNRARIWTHNDFHHFSSDPTPGEMYDVALLELESPIALESEGGEVYAEIAAARPEDGEFFWINGRKLDGEESVVGMSYRAIATDDLPATDPRYPFQFLAAELGLTDAGDSGGPLFRERAHAVNDGQGGVEVPVVYGLIWRGGSYARLDPIKSWIDERAAAMLRASRFNEGDLTWAECWEPECDIYAATDTDGTWTPMGTVPHGTKMGVFAEDGDTLVVSYPMPDRDYAVQVADRSQFLHFSGFHDAPPAEDLRAESRYCASAVCPIYAKRNLEDPDQTPIGAVVCGQEMGVFFKTDTWAVVSYPMEDRGRAVQVVPVTGGGWRTTPPPPGSC